MERRVPSLVLTADLSAVTHQHRHYIQVTCRGQSSRVKRLSSLVSEDVEKLEDLIRCELDEDNMRVTGDPVDDYQMCSAE